MTFSYQPGPAVPAGLTLLHLSPDPLHLGRTYPADLALVGDPKATLEALAPMVQAGVDAAAARELVAAAEREVDARWREVEARMLAEASAVPPSPEAACHALMRALPLETVVVEESPTADAHVRAFHRVTRPDRFFYSRGGGLGWGMAAALGVSLGLEREPVVCVVGDGSTLYSPQALWSAARLRLPVVFVVFNNGQYQILKRFLRARDNLAVRTGRFVGLDLADPTVDFVSLAGSLGVGATRVTRAAEIGDAVRVALERGAPHVVEVPLAAE